MDLLHLVDRLEELVAGAQKMPIGNRAIVDRRRMLDLIDRMRVAVPHEVREAQEIVANRDGIRREAEEEGRIIIAEAEGHAVRMVEDHSITEAAKRRAEEIAREAERRLEARIDEANRDIQARLQESRRLAREQMEAADEYARELLLRLERQLQAFQNSIRAGVQQLDPRPTFEPSLPPLDDFDDDGGGYGEAYDRDDERVATAARDERRWERGDEPEAPRPARRGASAPAMQSDGELENLLQRTPAPRSRREQTDPGVIDDFEMEPLDDDPTYRAPREDDDLR